MEKYGRASARRKEGKEGKRKRRKEERKAKFPTSNVIGVDGTE
jgi:hypothetical protein